MSLALLLTTITPTAGLCFMGGSLLLIIRATHMYYYRMNQIRYRGGGEWNDSYTPLFVAAVVIAGILTVAYGRTEFGFGLGLNMKRTYLAP
jgi:hypothetical protein